MAVAFEVKVVEDKVDVEEGVDDADFKVMLVHGGGGGPWCWTPRS